MLQPLQQPWKAAVDIVLTVQVCKQAPQHNHTLHVNIAA
jgi:hypothetical protein